jgi:hypothetical protein
MRREGYNTKAAQARGSRRLALLGRIPGDDALPRLPPGTARVGEATARRLLLMLGLCYPVADLFVNGPSRNSMNNIHGELTGLEQACEQRLSTIISGTLIEIRDAFIVLTGPTYIMLPPGMEVENLVVGEALIVTATSQDGRLTAERIERGPA